MVEKTFCDACGNEIETEAGGKFYETDTTGEIIEGRDEEYCSECTTMIRRFIKDLKRGSKK